MASSNQETRTVTDVILRMDVEEAIAVYALASRGEELPEGHPVRDLSQKVFVTLSETLRGADTYEARHTAYRSIDVIDNRDR